MKLEGDASQMVCGRRKASGLARYCNDAGKLNNVKFSAAEQRSQTWGVRALIDIKKGTELLVSYGDLYWKSNKKG